MEELYIPHSVGLSGCVGVPGRYRKLVQVLRTLHALCESLMNISKGYDCESLGLFFRVQVSLIECLIILVCRNTWWLGASHDVDVPPSLLWSSGDLVCRG